MNKKGLRRLALALAAIAAVVAIANIPLTTLQGVNYVVTPRVLPAYVKAIDFVERDVNYGQLAAQVTAGARSDEAKMRAVFDWTRANVRSTPEGFPVIDDHVWHIVIRGYGQDDQKADVFTTLLTYAGVPAYWIFIGPRPELTLSLVRVNGRWRAIDVANGVIFKAPDGQLATAEDVAADHRLAIAQGPAQYGGIEYGRYFDRFRAPDAPAITRPEMQMLWPRLWFNMKRMAGRGGRPWEMRPASREAAVTTTTTSRQ
jgi:hypothetical protein